MENKVPLMIFGLNEENGISNCFNGNFKGTIVTAD
jgi:uridylate kinase